MSATSYFDTPVLGAGCGGINFCWYRRMMRQRFKEDSADRIRLTARPSAKTAFVITIGDVCHDLFRYPCPRAGYGSINLSDIGIGT
jgi:hypothetical protein